MWWELVGLDTLFLALWEAKGEEIRNHHHLTLEAELTKLDRNSPGEGDLNPAAVGMKPVPRPVCLLQG